MGAQGPDGKAPITKVGTVERVNGDWVFDGWEFAGDNSRDLHGTSVSQAAIGWTAQELADIGFQARQRELEIEAG